MGLRSAIEIHTAQCCQIRQEMGNVELITLSIDDVFICDPKVIIEVQISIPSSPQYFVRRYVDIFVSCLVKNNFPVILYLLHSPF